MSKQHLFVFGLGYSALHLARELMQEGWRVSGTVRSEEKKNEMNVLGIQTYVFSTEQPLENIGDILADVSHVLSSVPPKNQLNDPVLEKYAEDIKKAKHLEWIGYLSTTGVYGDRQGDWVDETSELLPTGPRGEARVQGEKEWFELGVTADIPVHSFRLAGIYGPGRSAIETVLKGKARCVNKPGQVFSRIHIDDITQILKASMLRPNAGAAYNVCDDFPESPSDVICYACDLLNVSRPELVDFETAELSPMARSFYRDNKRVSNEKIKTELGVKLKWPEYKQALREIAKLY